MTRHLVLGFEIRHFFENLRSGKPSREEIENITDTNAHPTNAWPATTLLGIDRDSIGKLIHRTIVPAAAREQLSMASRGAGDGRAGAADQRSDREDEK